MVVYVSDPKYSTRKLLNLINSFSEVGGYKMYSNKSMSYLYTKDKQAETEIRSYTRSRPARKNAANRNLLWQNFIAYIFRSKKQEPEQFHNERRSRGYKM